MEKYVDERALRHFRDKAVEVDLQPKIDKLQTNLENAEASLTDRMDEYVRQLCYVKTKGGPLSPMTTSVSLSVAGLYSARLVVWINGRTSKTSNPVFSISASGTGATDDFVQVPMGGGGEAASGSIALDIMSRGSSGEFYVVASGCVRVGDDVTLVQGFREISGSSANLTIKITPTSAIGGVARCGYSYSALYNAESLVGD